MSFFISSIASLLDFYESGKTESITIKIECDKPKSVTLNSINSAWANPLSLWKEMGSPQTPSPRQIKELQEGSKPSAEEAEYEYDNGYITVPVSLSSNEIKRIIIR